MEQFVFLPRPDLRHITYSCSSSRVGFVAVMRVAVLELLWEICGGKREGERGREASMGVSSPKYEGKDALGWISHFIAVSVSKPLRTAGY